MTWVVPNAFLTSRIRTLAMLFLPWGWRPPPPRARSLLSARLAYLPLARHMIGRVRVSMSPATSAENGRKIKSPIVRRPSDAMMTAH
jgi:hypothetical protein